MVVELSLPEQTSIEVPKRRKNSQWMQFTILLKKINNDSLAAARRNSDVCESYFSVRVCLHKPFSLGLNILANAARHLEFSTLVLAQLEILATI
ncbi:hypothetical protein ABIC60_004576 [Phyllobacterium ifriqiyense]